MFKKGQIQLQAEIRSDEDLDHFLRRDGIVVLDIHPSWCGPCVSMLSTLKKLKFEIGDTLSLGECTADTINKLSRFSNRCEPTFLICSHQKVVRSVFSASIPKLIHAIKEELEREHLHKLGKIQRVFYDFDKQSPGEIERDAEKVAKEKEIARIAKEKADKEFHEKLENLIALVTENIPDTWLTMFFPHAAQYYNKTFAIAQDLGMIYRDKNNTRLMEEWVPYLMYKNKNPWDPDLINYMLDKDLLCVLWSRSAMAKIKDFTVAAPRFLKQLTNPPPPPPEVVEKPEGEETPEPEAPTGPTFAEMFKTLSIPLEVEKPAEDQEASNENASESQEKLDESQVPEQEQEAKPEETEEVKETEEPQEEDSPPEIPPEETSPESDVEQKDSTTEKQEPEKEDNEATIEEKPASSEEAVAEGEGKQETTEESEEKPVEDIPEVAVESTEIIGPREPKTTLEIPPIWIPYNEEANALAIHVFFRRLTQYFVPADPEPEPNHVCIIFPSSARKEIYETFKTFEREIPLYGFFTSDNLRETKVISKSYQKYEMKSPNDDDKLIMRVNRRNDQALLAFAQLNPIYISMNDREGHEDCATVFNTEFLEFLDEIEDPNRGEKRRSSRRKSSIAKPDSTSVGKLKEISTEIETIAETLIDTEEP